MSTGCEFHADALAELAAGRLEPARVARVREHMAECGACRADFELISRIAAVPAVPPAGLEGRIRAAVREVSGSRTAGTSPADTRRPIRWRPWVVPLAGAAGLALVWVGLSDRTADPAIYEEVVVSADFEEPYGAWPATGPEVAGEPVLSELSADDLELLLEEMEP